MTSSNFLKRFGITPKIKSVTCWKTFSKLSMTLWKEKTPKYFLEGCLKLCTYSNHSTAFSFFITVETVSMLLTRLTNWLIGMDIVTQFSNFISLITYMHAITAIVTKRLVRMILKLATFTVTKLWWIWLRAWNGMMHASYELTYLFHHN